MLNFKFIKCASILFVLTFVLFAHNVSLAQEQQGENFGFTNVGPDSAECFKYYPFGKIDFTLDTDKGQYGPGETIVVSGTANNRHLTSPITDGSFLVQLRRLEDEKSAELFIDQKVVPSNIVIPPSSGKDVNFNYQLPSYLPSGRYILSTFLISAGKFNIAGLPFIPNVPGDLQGFIVKGSDELNLPYFDPEKSFVNGIKYSRNLPAVRVEGNIINVNTIVVNPASFKQTVQVEKKLFHWDDVNPDNFLNGEKETLSLDAGKQAATDFVAASLPPGVYMVVFEASSSDKTKTIFRIRFALPGNRVRLVYSGFSSYPIKEGDKTQVISCFSNEVTTNSSGKNDLEIVVSGTKKTSSGSFDSEIAPSSFVGMTKHDYTAGASDDLSITAQVSEDGNIVDKTTISYQLKDFVSTGYPLIKIIAGIGIFMILFIFIFWKRRLFLRSKGAQIMIFAILITSGVLFIFPGQSRADQSTSYINYLMPNEFGESVLALRAGISLLNTLSVDLTPSTQGWEKFTATQTLNRSETGEWYVVGGSFDSPFFDYYCDYGSGRELCKRDTNGDGVKDQKIIFSQVSWEEALTIHSSLVKIPPADFDRYAYLEKEWVKDSQPVCFRGEYVDVKDKTSAFYPTRVEVLCAMKRGNDSENNYSTIRNFNYKVHAKNTSTESDDTYKIPGDNALLYSSIRLRWKNDGSWVNNAADMYFKVSCDYDDTYTTDNSEVGCSTNIGDGKTSCSVGNINASVTKVDITLKRKFENCQVNTTKKVGSGYIHSEDRNDKISEKTIMTSSQPSDDQLSRRGGADISISDIKNDITLTSITTAKLGLPRKEETLSVDLKIKKYGADDSTYTDSSVTINSGEGVTLKWTSLDAASCSITSNDSGQLGWYSGIVDPAGGTMDLLGLTSFKNYELLCSGTGGSKTDSVSANIFGKQTLTCSDGIQNQDETGIDTGGICTDTVVIGYSLTVNISGNCTGSIYNKERSDSTGGTKNYTSYASGDKVTLTATPGAYSEETCKMAGGWNISSGGNCAGGKLSKNNTKEDTCELTMGSADKSLSVSFDKPGVALYCGDTQCSTEIGETCSTCSNDCGACVIIPDYYNLTLKKKGDGKVKLYAWRDSPWNDYGDTADNDFQNNETNSLKKNWWFKMTAAPDSGWSFSGWSGCTASDPKGTAPSSDENACFVTMNSDNKTATVTFNDSTGGGGGGGGGGSSVKAYISADMTTTDEGTTRQITWTSDNATSCAPSDGDSGWVDDSRSNYKTTGGTYTTTPFGSSGRTYSVECTDGSQKGDASASITVPSGGYRESPVVTMWADPNTINSGKTTKLKWLASNSLGCYLFQSSPSEFYSGGNYMKLSPGYYYGTGYYLPVSTGETTGKETVKFYNAGKTVARVYPPMICANSFGSGKGKATIAVNPAVSNFTLTNPTGESLAATIVEGLSANSSSVALTLSGETIGNINLSGSIPAISGAKAQFATSADNGSTWSAWNNTPLTGLDIGATSQIKIRAINIPGATATGTYNVALTATDSGSGGITKKLNVNLKVSKVSSEWREF